METGFFELDSIQIGKLLLRFKQINLELRIDPNALRNHRRENLFEPKLLKSDPESEEIYKL